MSVLEQIVDGTREQVTLRRERTSLDELRQASEAQRAGRRAFAAVLRGAEIAVIAEHKRRSPSAGLLRADSSIEEIVGAYERGGAAALSVLTEEQHFAGSLGDLRSARAASRLPVLRKDFIIDPFQLYESAAAGADAILLIVAALGADELGVLHALALELGLDVVVEVHDEHELDVALAVAPRMIGINNRDLTDFSVDVRRTFALLDRIEEGITVISESGISSPAQLVELRDAGVHAVLVGERLMRAPDPEAALRTLMAREL